MSATTIKSKIGEPCLSVVTALERRPRRGIPDLLTLTTEMDSCGLAVLKHAAADILARNPRYPVQISVATGCYSPEVVEVLKRAELASDKGLAELLGKATALVKEHPRHPQGKKRSQSACACTPASNHEAPD